MVVVEPLENELCTAVSEPSIAIVLPYLLETKIREETATGIVILAAGKRMGATTSRLDLSQQFLSA